MVVVVVIPPPVLKYHLTIETDSRDLENALNVETIAWYLAPFHHNPRYI